MINIIKSQPAPSCLAIEKTKASGDYNCGDVTQRLRADFHDKCYLCESKGLIPSNTDHFVAHQGNINLKFDWNNLFWICGHCNNTKLNKYLNLLNCTDSTVKITDVIKFMAYGIPKEHLVITSVQDEPNFETQQTVELLNLIYKGSTKRKEMETENLRDNVTKEIVGFTEYLREFYEVGLNTDEKEAIKVRVRRKLSPESPFTAFKIWIIKSNPSLTRDFGHFLP